MKRTTLISVAIVSIMSAIATNSFGSTAMPSAAQKEFSTRDNVPHNVTRSTAFDDAWRKPSYANKFKEGKFFFYVISDTENTVGVAPCNGIDDNVYQYDMEIPESISHNGKTYTVVAVGRTAFANMFNLNHIKLPKTIRYIGKRAFWGCAIKEIEIPDATEEIDDGCFEECPKLLNITIGKGLAKIGEDALSGCWDIKSITVDKDNPTFSNRDGALYTKDETVVLKYPSYRRDVTKVVLPNTVTKIAEGAFEYCEYITEITLNEGLKEIGAQAFYLCRRLESMKIPASVEKIADGSAFSLLAGCKNFEVAKGNTTYEVRMDGRLLVEKATNTAVSLLFTNDLNPVTIPDGIEHIGKKAMLVLYENSSLEASYRNKGPREIFLPNSLKSIGNLAFSGCNIHSIKIPDAVEKISRGAFLDCANLSYVEIGKGCKTVGEVVFSKCPALASRDRGIIRVYAETPPRVVDEGGENADIDEDVTKKAQLQVPEASISKYQGAAGWKKFIKIVKLEGQSSKEVQGEDVVLKPSQGALYIQTPEVGQVNIYSISGNLVYSTSKVASRVELLSGIYLVTYKGNAHKVYIP